ncbi:MAG: DNA repair protein RecO [Deltaproteobacteria bacterium]|nr:DNA repair protein RecO [Deltaproteobacteria bacterium]
MVVRLIAYRESDRVVKLVTPDGGLVSAIVPGARRSVKRFSNVFDIGNRILVRVAVRKRGMARVEAGKLLDGYWPLSQSAAGVAALEHVVELARRFSAEDHAEPEIYRLSVAALEDLAAHGVRPRVLRTFELRLLGAAGLAPNLEHCVVCKKAARENAAARYSVARFGIVCSACTPGRELTELSAATRAWMRETQSAPFGELFTIPAPAGAVEPLADLLPRQVEYHLGAPLKALRYARRLVKPDEYHGVKADAG